MRMQPNRDYVSVDEVMTPPGLARALVEALAPYGVVLEPCAGEGAFFVALTDYMGDDADVLACEIRAGKDFFAWSQRVDWIITNPPWSKFAAFLERSLTLADHVVFLVTVNHWWTKRRVRLVRDAGFGYCDLLLVDWPKGWHSTGFQLGAMHLARGYDGPLQIRTVTWEDDDVHRARRDADSGAAPRLFAAR